MGRTAFRIELGELAKGGDERFLRKILRFMRLFETHREARPHRTLMPADQL
jgi:hypothetical protein